MLVMYSSQYPSSNGSILPNTPSASVRSQFQLFLVIFCVSKISYFEGSRLSERCPRVQFSMIFNSENGFVISELSKGRAMLLVDYVHFFVRFLCSTCRQMYCYTCC